MQLSIHTLIQRITPKNILNKHNSYKHNDDTNKYSAHPATQRYLKFLKFKDSQNLIFWADDNYPSYNDERTNVKKERNERVAAFYKYLSERLSKMYCPIQKRYYSPLKTIYTESCEYQSHFGVSKDDLFKELYFLTLKFKAMMEIIHQSNSESLNAMISYSPENVSIKYTQNIINKDLEMDGFWISPDYDPYDINIDIDEPVI